MVPVPVMVRWWYWCRWRWVMTVIAIPIGRGFRGNGNGHSRRSSSGAGTGSSSGTAACVLTVIFFIQSVKIAKINIHVFLQHQNTISDIFDSLLWIVRWWCRHFVRGSRGGRHDGAGIDWSDQWWSLPGDGVGVRPCMSSHKAATVSVSYKTIQRYNNGGDGTFSACSSCCSRICSGYCNCWCCRSSSSSCGLAIFSNGSKRKISSVTRQKPTTIGTITKQSATTSRRSHTNLSFQYLIPSVNYIDEMVATWLSRKSSYIFTAASSALLVSPNHKRIGISMPHYLWSCSARKCLWTYQDEYYHYCASSHHDKRYLHIFLDLCSLLQHTNNTTEAFMDRLQVLFLCWLDVQ